MASGAGGRGGGGKIRTRWGYQERVHPCTWQRQQHQGSGLPECFKNIVPAWLQRYFNKTEDGYGCSTHRRKVPGGQGTAMASGARGRGGGGGKIRVRRRCQGRVHPYGRGRQQHQGSGLPECIKNIVPAWLQRYFSKTEDAYSHSTDTRKVPHGQGKREVDHVTQATEASSNINDGKMTPAPPVRKRDAPSTTSTASKGADGPPGPSAPQRHLNVSTVESPASPCQPPMSSAFPTGTSGFSLGKEIKDPTSWHDENSSTTSSFSSRSSEKDRADSKNTSLPTRWSPEAGRSHSLPQRAATSSKKPAFRSAPSGTLSSSLGNSSILKANQLRGSPSYPGKTTYAGAAAAVRQSKLRRTPYQAPVIRQMEAEQLHAPSDGATSLAARRILHSLEKMSSPLLDAKRIPSGVSCPLDRSGIHSTDFQAKKGDVDSQYLPVHRFMIPKPVPTATSSSSSNPASSSFKLIISSSSSGPSQTLTITGNITFGDKGGFKIDVSSDSGAVSSMSGSF